MPFAKLNPLITSIRGKIGDLVFVQVGDETWVRRRADAELPLSEARQAQLNRLGEVSRRAKQLLLDPAIKAEYQRACIGHLNTHNLAVRDFMHAPVIQSIQPDRYTGKPGDVIQIIAEDDFKITCITVQIRTVTGEVLEEGPADWTADIVSAESAAARESKPAGKWSYTAQRTVPPGSTILIEATAMDLPGNQAKAKTYFYVQP
jgi:hypothetical protein